jgi:type IV pilus assembly protein PilC
MGFAEAMESEQHMFSDFERCLIRTAETSGTLDVCLAMLSEWCSLQTRLARMVISGMLWPVFCLHIAGLVFPLPALVLGKIGVWEYMCAVMATWSIFYIPAGLVMGVRLLKSTRFFIDSVLDVMVLWVPVLRKAVWEISVARFARAFHAMYKGGVPIVESLQQAIEVTGNTITARAFAGTVEHAAVGEAASKGFTRKIPREYIELWKIGEESGELDKMSQKIADLAMDRGEFWLTQFARWVPRFIYGIIVIIMIWQVFKMAGQIGSVYRIGF